MSDENDRKWADAYFRWVTVVLALLGILAVLSAWLGRR